MLSRTVLRLAFATSPSWSPPSLSGRNGRNLKEHTQGLVLTGRPRCSPPSTQFTYTSNRTKVTKSLSRVRDAKSSSSVEYCDDPASPSSKGGERCLVCSQKTHPLQATASGFSLPFRSCLHPFSPGFISSLNGLYNKLLCISQNCVVYVGVNHIGSGLVRQLGSRIPSRPSLWTSRMVTWWAGVPSGRRR